MDKRGKICRAETKLATNLQPTCNQLATDCISRQALLNAISQKEYGHDYDENTDILGLKYVDIIKRMPSVEPERKMGKWIEKEGYDGDVYYDCSVCGNSWTTIDGTPWDNGMNYCPKCGARMGVENK